MTNEQKRWLDTFVIKNKICEGCGLPIPVELSVCPFCKAYRFEEDPITLRERISENPAKFNDEWRERFEAIVNFN